MEQTLRWYTVVVVSYLTECLEVDQSLANRLVVPSNPYNDKACWRDDGQEQYKKLSVLGLFDFIRTDTNSARIGSSSYGI